MAKEKESTFLGGIRLASGKELDCTTNPEEIYWFHKTNGLSITQPKKKGGGKSKGARTRGRKGVHRTSEERA